MIQSNSGTSTTTQQPQKQAQKQPQKQAQQQARHEQQEFQDEMIFLAVIFSILLLFLGINVGIAFAIIQKNNSTSTLSNEELNVVKSDCYYGLSGCVSYFVGMIICFYFYRYPPVHKQGVKIFIYCIIGLTLFLNIIVPVCITSYNWSKVSYNDIFTKSKTLVGTGLARYAYLYNGFMCFIIAMFLIFVAISFVKGVADAMPKVNGPNLMLV